MFGSHPIKYEQFQQPAKKRQAGEDSSSSDKQTRKPWFKLNQPTVKTEAKVIPDSMSVNTPTSSRATTVASYSAVENIDQDLPFERPFRETEAQNSLATQYESDDDSDDDYYEYLDEQEEHNEKTPLVDRTTSVEGRDRTGTMFSSIFTLVSTMIGGGLLSLPFAFEQGGFLIASFVLVFVLMASTYGGFLIINSKKYCRGKIRNIEDVAKVAFGIKGQRLVQVVLILILYLASVAYYILISDQLEPLILYMARGKLIFWTKRLVVLTMIAIFVFPISLLKNLSALQITSSLSVFCGALLCGCIVYRSAENNMGGFFHRTDNPVRLYPKNLRNFLTCVSIAELTFSCHFNILPMHTELRHQTRSNKRVILCSAMGLTYIMNLMVSFFGYMQFRKYTDQDITKNYPHDDIVITTGRVALAFVLLLSYPLLIVPCRQTLNKIFWNHERVIRLEAFGGPKWLRCMSNSRLNGPSKIVWFVETFVIVFSGYALANIIPQVNMIWGMVGAVGCTLIIYILPPTFYLKVRAHPEKPDVKQVFACILLVCGIFLLFAGAYQSVMNIIDPIPELRPMSVISGNATAVGKNETLSNISTLL